MTIHVAHLTEDHLAVNRSWRDACDAGACTPDDCEANCYDLQPQDPA
jgi:hypothetical protein